MDERRPCFYNDSIHGCLQRTKLSFAVHCAFICGLFNLLAVLCLQNIRIMKKRYTPLMALTMSGLLSLSCAGLVHAQNYRFHKEIPVGGEGGWDYLSIDAKARRLYISHATKVVVIDLEKE